MENIEILDHAFANCSKLEYIDASLWRTQSLYDVRGIFSNCASLTRLNCRNWTTRRVVDFSLAFSGCKNLESLDLSNWDFSNASTMEEMFSGCKSLKSIKVNNWNVKKAYCKKIFYNCQSLECLNLKGFDYFNLPSPEPSPADTFYKCYKLRSLIGGSQSLDEEIFKEARHSIHLGYSALLDRPSIRAIINGVPNRRNPYYSVGYRLGIYLNKDVRAWVTDADIAIATGKGWDVYFWHPIYNTKAETYSGDLSIQKRESEEF